MVSKDARFIWAEVVERVKDRTISPALWRALEKAVGVTIEDGQLIIGFTSPDMPMSGHLRSGDHKNTIESCIAEVAGEPLRLRMIEGLTVADWEAAKRREAAAEAARASAARRRAHESEASKTWDVLMEQVSRRYANTPMRQFPQMRAKYLADATQMIVEAMETLYPAGSEVDELAERALARLIEKIATLIDVPSVVVANGILRSRGEIT
jgi:hypothetical protein